MMNDDEYGEIMMNKSFLKPFYPKYTMVIYSRFHHAFVTSHGAPGR